MCMYVSEICAEGIFVTFPWWLRNMKSRSKIPPFSNEWYFEIWFPKKRTITFFWSKLSKLHKKDPILHVATTFSLKQGETRTSHGPIPHPLIYVSQHKVFRICTKGHGHHKKIDKFLPYFTSVYIKMVITDITLVKWCRITFLLIGRLWPPVCEAFSYGIRHVSLWFTEA